MHTNFKDLFEENILKYLITFFSPFIFISWRLITYNIVVVFAIHFITIFNIAYMHVEMIIFCIC